MELFEYPLLQAVNQCGSIFKSYFLVTGNLLVRLHLLHVKLQLTSQYQLYP
jgi:hypothetical protein